MNIVKIVLVVLAFFVAVSSYALENRRTRKTTVRVEKDAKVEKSEPTGNKGDFSKKTTADVQQADQETEVITLFKMINSNWSRSRRVAHKRLRELGADGTAVYIKILLDGKRVNREYAAKMLGEYPSKEGVAALRQALLTDNVARVRITCAESLAVIADRSSLDDLITALGDKNRKVREKAIYAIGKMGDEHVVPALIKILKDENPETRQMVVFSLGELRDERATQPLIETTLDPDAGVRAASAVALAKIGTRTVVDEIIGMLGDKSSDVRLSAVMALNILDDEKSVQPLIAMLSDENGDVREVAFETLKKMDRQALLKALIQAMSSTNVNARIDASGWLTEVGASEAIPCLIKGTKDDEWRVRYYSAMALGNIGDKRAEKALRYLLDDEKTGIRVEALKSLGKIGDESAEALLINIVLNTRDKAEAIEAIQALGDIKTPGAVGLIVQKFQDPDPEISRAAGKALMNYGDALYDCMNSESSDIRRSIVIAVGLLGKPESSAILLKGLEDSDPSVRVASFKSLEKVGDKKAVKKTLNLLDDRSPNVRIAAVSYLIFCENGNVVDDVVKKLGDKNYLVRAVVLQAIAEFNARKYLPEVKSALKKDQPYVRAIAAEALAKIGKDDDDTIKVLLDALSTDEAINVRLNSASSLRELTGNNFGYTKDALSSEKYEAVRKWKKWWRENRGG